MRRFLFSLALLRPVTGLLPHVLVGKPLLFSWGGGQRRSSYIERSAGDGLVSTMRDTLQYSNEEADGNPPPVNKRGGLARKFDIDRCAIAQKVRGFELFLQDQRA